MYMLQNINNTVKGQILQVTVIAGWRRVYRRLGFECEILLITNCEFLYKTQWKESQEKEYAMNNVTCDHTPFARVLTCDRKHARVIDISRMFDLLEYMYVQLSIVENESSLILQASCQPANTIANAKPSTTVARAVWYSINSPSHMQPHKPHLYG